MSTEEQANALRAALKPFADFFVNGAPDDYVITAGSRMAKRQLTMGDCRLAAMTMAFAADQRSTVGVRLADLRGALDRLEIAIAEEAMTL